MQHCTASNDIISQDNVDSSPTPITKANELDIKMNCAPTLSSSTSDNKKKRKRKKSNNKKEKRKIKKYKKDKCKSKISSADIAAAANNVASDGDKHKQLSSNNKDQHQHQNKHIRFDSHDDVDYDITSKYTGKGCVVSTDVTIVRFRPSVIEVDSHAFAKCRYLREVIFNERLQKIGEKAFSDCTSLSSIILPSTVTEIGNYTFSNCSNLREVVLHGVPREIGWNAFRNCTSLERFTFPTISSRLDNLIQTGHWPEIENEVSEVRGVVERSGGDLFVLSTRSLREGGRN